MHICFLPACASQLPKWGLSTAHLHTYTEKRLSIYLAHRYTENRKLLLNCGYYLKEIGALALQFIKELLKC